MSNNEQPIGWPDKAEKESEPEWTLEQAVNDAFARVRHATHYTDEAYARENLLTWVNAHYVRKGLE
jgi:hypothetical protein